MISFEKLIHDRYGNIRAMEIRSMEDERGNFQGHQWTLDGEPISEKMFKDICLLESIDAR